MLTFLADENFHRGIVRGLLRRKPDLDIVRVQDVGLSGVDDPTVLEWAAKEDRLLLTHDVVTITKFAYERVAQGLSMPGGIEIKQSIGRGQAIDDILLLAECSLPDEHEGQVRKSWKVTNHKRNVLPCGYGERRASPHVLLIGTNSQLGTEHPR